MSASSTRSGGSPRNGSSRSSGGNHGTPNASVDRLFVRRVRQRLQRLDVCGRSGRTQKAVPNCSGEATTNSSGTPSTVTPTARRSLCSTTATICGSPTNRATTGPGSDAAQTTVSASLESHHRRTSPATSPPRAVATPPTSSHAFLMVSPRRGRGSPSRASAPSSSASRFGPIPGTSRSRPAAAAARSSSAVRTSSARAISTERFAPRPRYRPRPTMSGDSSRSSSASSAIWPVSTSSRNRVSIDRPIPRSERTRPDRTSSSTGAAEPRIVSAARR